MLFVFSIITIKRSFNIFLPFVLSPAILMAIERCNNDIIIFLLLLIAGKLSLSKNKSQLIISHLLLFIAIGLKYYPVAFASIYLCRHEKLSKTLFHLSIQIIFFIFWILFCWEDLLIQKFTIPEPVYAYCIGLFPIVNFFSNILNINYIFSFYLLY